MAGRLHQSPGHVQSAAESGHSTRRQTARQRPRQLAPRRRTGLVPLHRAQEDIELVLSGDGVHAPFEGHCGVIDARMTHVGKPLPLARRLGHLPGPLVSLVRNLEAVAKAGAGGQSQPTPAVASVQASQHVQGVAQTGDRVLVPRLRKLLAPPNVSRCEAEDGAAEL